MDYFTDLNIDAVMQEKGISATAARVLYHINRFVHASRIKGIRDRRGIPYSYASREAIARRVGKSARTVARAISELKAAGLIEVQRTRRNAHIFMCYYGVCGTSATAENGTSNNSNTKNINNIASKSIYLHKTGAIEGQLSVDGLMNNASATQKEKAQEPTRAAAPRPEAEEKKPDRTKGRPTPRQRQRITKAEKEAARQRYQRHLEKRLGLGGFEWVAFPEEYSRLCALVDMIADAMSVKSRQIKVDGCYLTVDQYWDIVKNIEYNDNIAGLFDRVKSAEVCHGIVNQRAYMLAAVYKAVQWDRVMQGAEVSRAALYRSVV